MKLHVIRSEIPPRVHFSLLNLKKILNEDFWIVSSDNLASLIIKNKARIKLATDNQTIKLNHRHF